MNLLMQQYLLHFKKIDAVKFETGPDKGFTIKDHEKNPDASRSPVYFNFRTKDNPKPGPLGDEEIEQMADFMLNLTESIPLHFRGVAGVPNAGNPIAKSFVEQALLSQLDVKLLKLGKVTEDDKRHISGLAEATDLPRGETVLLIDDLATKAGSKEEAVSQLRAAGYVVRDCMVFLDRQQGAMENLAGIGVQLHSVVTLDDALSFYRESGYITAGTYRIVQDYLKQNS